MANKYTPAQERAIRKYLDKTVSIQIRVNSDKREEYRNRATAEGKSLSQWIIDKLEEIK